jgi:hypothetical protein
MKRRLQRVRISLEQLPAEQVALLLPVGLVLGVFPIPIIPTFLCLAAAFTLRLNAAALQLLNNVTSPLQLALLLPLARAGAWFCAGEEGVPAFGMIGKVALQAVMGWALICVPLGALLYAGSVLLIRRRRASCSNSLETLA